MAYVKVVPVATRQHLFNLLNYSHNEDKTLDMKFVHSFDCQIETAYNDFMSLHDSNRRGHLLAHHIIQSFRPGETTPEEAHQLGVELVQKMLPGYQFTISTHVDREHIHNHISFNAISYMTGARYNSNKTTLQAMQNASDQICREHGLSVINKSGYHGLDRSTYELARKGRSWKVKLANDLDGLFSSTPPANMEAFAQAIRDKGYYVKLTERHITVTKIGEKKGIRLDTLARQFGMQYTKDNIARWIAGEPLDLEPPSPVELASDAPAPEWQRLEETRLVPNVVGKQNRQPGKYSETGRRIALAKTALATSLGVRSTIRNAVRLNMLMADPTARLEYEQYKRWLDTRSISRVKVVERPKVSNTLRQFGNITAARLYSVPGETVSMKVTPEQAAAFRGMGIFYAGRITDAGDLRVTFKAVNAVKVAEVLNIPEHLIKSQEEQQDERWKRAELKDYLALHPNTQKISWQCSAEDLAKLDQAHIRFDYTRQRTGYRVGIAEQDVGAVCAVLNVPEEDIRKAVTAYNNRTAYRALKTAASKTGERVVYRIMGSTQLELLQEMGVLCVAYDTEDGRKNVALLSSDIPAYEKICSEAKDANLQVYDQIKRVAAAHGEKPVYRVVTRAQLDLYLEMGITCAYFPKGENMNIAMTRAEWNRLQDLLEQQRQNTRLVQQEKDRQRHHKHSH